MTHVFLDVETTGLDRYQHEVWEIAYAVDDGPILSSFVRHSIRGADPHGLRLGGYWDRWPGEESPYADGFEQNLMRLLAESTLVAANPSFDAAMLETRWGVAPWHHRLLDVQTYAMPLLGLSEPISLSGLATALSIKQPDHTAEQDVRALRDCYLALVSIYDKSNFAYTRPENARRYAAGGYVKPSGKTGTP